MSTEVSSIWYWLIFLIYCVLVVYLGWIAYRKQKTATSAEEEHNDYWITGRKQPAYLVGMSIASGWMLIGMITWMTWATYDQGLTGSWMVVIPWTIALFIYIPMVGYIRKVKAISQCQMLHNRFGLPARILSAPINIFSYTLWSAAELYAASLIMAPALGLSVKWMIIIYAIPVAAYMWMGGFRSVVNANVLQFFMGAGILVAVAIGTYLTARGIAIGQDTTIWAMLKNQDIVNSMAYPLKEGATATTFFGFASVAFPLIIFIALLPGWSAAEDYWLKAQSAINTREARKGTLYSLIYNLVFIVLCASFVGLMGIIIFPPELKDGVLSSAAALGDTGGYNVISVYINEYMSPWLKAILIFLLSAHSMSTVANYSNVTSMNLSYDILQPLIYRKKKWTDEKIMKWARGITLVIIGVNVLIAMLYDSPMIGASLNDAYFLSSGLLTAGVAIMVFSLWWKRANLTGVMAGGISGTLATIIFFILEYKVWNFSYTMPVWDWIFGKGSMASSYLGYCVVGFVFGLAGLIIGTYLTEPPTKEQLESISDVPIDDTDEFFEGVRQTS
ncbi:MAG: sodium:solute symporter [Firmicutes bacterium HGW-Firmicutes-14]|nr:MAG: sodium:solute symporter [Firmicutes bacterium HGW-Firmicutes-14]